MDDFIESLKRENQENMIDELYKETIFLYSKKKGFSFQIELFLKIYKKKDLCSELIKIFKEMNEAKDNENNIDKKPYLISIYPNLKQLYLKLMN